MTTVKTLAIEVGKACYATQLINWGSPICKPVLVFLHDALGSIRQWKNFPAKLSEMTGLSALVYDRAGHGGSTGLPAIPRDKGYLHNEALEVLPAFLQQMGVTEPVIVGHSDGGTIALIYAAHHPVHKVVTLAAHIAVEEETLAGVRKTVAIQEQLLPKLERYHGQKAGALFKAWHQIWLSESFRDWSIETEVRAIGAPVLIVQGMRDEYATPRHLQLIHSAIGVNAQSWLVPGAGHLLHKDAPEQLLSRIGEFI